jgi:hypothetical protein
MPCRYDPTQHPRGSGSKTPHAFVPAAEQKTTTKHSVSTIKFQGRALEKTMERLYNVSRAVRPCAVVQVLVPPVQVPQSSYLLWGLPLLSFSFFIIPTEERKDNKNFVRLLSFSILFCRTAFISQRPGFLSPQNAKNRDPFSRSRFSFKAPSTKSSWCVLPWGL